MVNLIKSNLGAILARSYKNSPDKFIPNDLKQILEELSDMEVNRGLIIGYENSRGFRTITDGTPELLISKQLEDEASECDIAYPQSSYILRELAKYRKSDAERDKTDRMLMDGLL